MSTDFKTRNKFYNTHRAMIDRCYNKKNSMYYLYGGRGITICDRWLNSLDLFELDMGEKPSATHTLDRIDNNKGYFPENCKWSTPMEQSANTRGWTNSQVKHKNISFRRDGGYRVRVFRRGAEVLCKSFKDLELAIFVRDEFLRSYK